MREYTKEQLDEICQDCNCKNDLARALGYTLGGYGWKQTNKIIEEYELDISHFDSKRANKYICELIEKICPVCQKEFTTKRNSKEKTVCSRSCSNTYFRSGKNNPNYISGAYTKESSWGSVYRKICFDVYDYKCALCPWDLIVEVHHIDGDNKNNDISNLIPLCPNHHRLTVMNKYKDDIQIKIDEWMEQNVK